MRAWTRARQKAPGRPQVALALAAALLSACDFFATREFSPKPVSVSTFAGSFAEGDTAGFRVTEFLARPGSSAADTVLSRLKLLFFRAPDSLQAGDGWTSVSVLVLSDPPGSHRDEGTLRYRIGEDGLVLEGSDSAAGGPRFYPLKLAASAQPGLSSPSAGSDSPAADTAGGFLSLPAVFTAGAAWSQPLGVLEVDRKLEAVDTLNFGGRLEESWKVAETVRDGGQVLSRGSYWYGASGLLKGEQVWDFAGRAADGSATAERELRRKLERL